jgi:hypothetical protein
MTTVLEAVTIAVMTVGAALGLALLVWLVRELFAGWDRR